MTDLRQRLSELDQLEAPDMRADIERRVQLLRGVGSEQPSAAARDDVIVVDIGSLEPKRARRGWPRYAIAAGTAAAAALVVFIAVALFDRAGEESPTGVVDSPDVEAREPAVPADADAPIPALVANLTVPVPAPPITQIDGMTISAGSLWIWGQDQIWSYTDGTWTAFSTTLAPTTASLQDLAFDGDTLWVLTDDGVVLFLDGNDWHSLPASLPDPVGSFAADPDSGILWLSIGSFGVELYRWDGEELTDVGHPPNWPESSDGGGTVGQIMVTRDGSVWAAGWHVYMPTDTGGLARYDDTTGSWELVRPDGADEAVPAIALVPASDGDVWAILTDWFDNRDASQEAGEHSVDIPFAHHDGATGEWTVHDAAGLPEAGPTFPWLMAADADAVWWVQETPGISSFDGRTWTRYVTDTPLADIAVAPDGTIWVTTGAGELRRFEP